MTAPEAETAEQVAEEEIEDETGLPAQYDAEQVEEAGSTEQDGGVLEETMQALYPRTSGTAHLPNLTHGKQRGKLRRRF